MKYLTREQRYTIYVMLQNGHSQKEIAEIISKDKSTISREIRRNRDKRNGVYKPELAQKKYNQRQKEKPKKKYFTEEIKVYVENKLSEDYRPEQIYGRAKIENVKYFVEMKDYKKIIKILDKDTEADTCRKEILPKIYAAGWNDDQIMEQRPFTDGRIIIIGKKAKRAKVKKADYLLRYSQNLPIAVIEAKRKYKTAATGIQQAKEYAEILQLKFAYASNGKEIIELDYITGIEKEIKQFPSPEELWNRLNEVNRIKQENIRTFLQPFYPNPDKILRYYQIIAINKVIQAILEGEKRVLLTMATGTGKTTTAFQIMYKLWKNRWNTKNENRNPKILFVADRSVLVEDPHSKDFAVFGDARCLIPDDGAVTSREIYFSTYQSLAEDGNRIGKFRNFPKDFFDLIVIDECHRGSASDESNWRVILDYFDTSVQLGLTATPLRNDNRDTYLYFGNPVYTYSLKQGIADGFLAPYVVHYVTPSTDTQHGWRPQKGQKDKYGNEIPDGVYSTPDFERNLSLLPRTKAVARHLSNLMAKNGKFDKTIIFCVNQEHADQMRRELNNLNTDIVKQNPNYVVRIVSEEGDIGKGLLSKFMDIEEPFPVIVTTSKLLSTGVDIPTCKNIVLFRQVNSMTEFKQIVGRGTRVREDMGKMYFRLIDYAGSANRQFADPEFDGEPPLITSEEINENGQIIDGTFVTEEDNFEDEITYDADFEDFDIENSTVSEPRTKFYVEEGEATIIAETVQILDENGKLITVQYTQYAKNKVTTMFTNADEFKQAWERPETRQEIIAKLANSGITKQQLEDITQIKDVDYFDLLCHIAYGMKPLTRRQRAENVKKARKLQTYSQKAQEIIQMIIDKYVKFGINELNPNILQVHPISEKGNITEIVSEFGGINEFKKVLEEIQHLLYVA